MEKFLKKNWNILFSIVLGLSIIILGIYRNHPKTDATRDGAFGFLISLLITFIFRFNNYQQLIEDNKDLISKFIKLIAAKSQLARTVELSHSANEINNSFYQFFLRRIYDEYNTHLQSISVGKYICNAETESIITKSILEYCNKCLNAVSFQDETWWTSNNGILYLEAHNQYVNKSKEKAVRIFIIESKSLDILKPTFKRHKELEIETYILFSDLDSIEEKYKVDFVIYDDYMLRRGSEVKNIEGGKDAVFTSDEIEVKKYSDLFHQLLVIAKAKNNNIPLS
ncbi:MAG TPA: hypothetical protein VIM55_19575 [Mucilaginibacter sp.]